MILQCPECGTYDNHQETCYWCGSDLGVSDQERSVWAENQTRSEREALLARLKTAAASPEFRRP